MISVAIARGDVIAKSREAVEDVWGIFVDRDVHGNKRGIDERDHLQSYFFRFSSKVVVHPGFVSFWRKLPLHNRRRDAIYRYELGFSARLRAMGFSIGGFIHWRRIVEELIAITDEALMARLLRYQCLCRADEARRIEPLLHRGDLSALQVRDLLIPEISRKKVFSSPFYLHPELLSRIGLPLIKKGRTRELIVQRREIIAGRYFAQWIASVQREILTWDEDKNRRF
jgi:hypothetical protein